MTALIFLSVLSLAGIGAAFWLLKSDRESEEDSLSDALDLAEETPGKKQPLNVLKNPLNFKRNSVKPADADTDKPAQDISEPAQDTGGSTQAPSILKKPLSLLTGLLEKFKLADVLKKFNIGKKDPEPEPEPEDASQTTPLSRLKEHFEDKEEDAPADEPETGTTSLKTVPSEEPAEKEPAVPSELSGLQEKYEKLDALFKEKSAELQKTKEFLDHEIQNRKEFNKIKDLLEKELKDSKDRTRDIQVEGADTKSEIERHEKRAAHLEEKMALLKKQLVEKDDKIDELVKRLQTFASPATAATPPVMEEPQESQEAAPAPSEDPAPEAPEEPVKEAPSGEIPADSAAGQDEDAAPTGGSFEAEPPEPYEEPSEDEEQREEEGGFLKLQPDVVSDGMDVVSDGPEKSNPIANEIEESLESPPDLEIKPDPGGASAPPEPEASPDRPDATPDSNSQEEKLKDNDNAKE